VGLKRRDWPIEHFNVRWLFNRPFKLFNRSGRNLLSTFLCVNSDWVVIPDHFFFFVYMKFFERSIEQPSQCIPINMVDFHHMLNWIILQITSEMVFVIIIIIIHLNHKKSTTVNCYLKGIEKTLVELPKLWLGYTTNFSNHIKFSQLVYL